MSSHSKWVSSELGESGARLLGRVAVEHEVGLQQRHAELGGGEICDEALRVRLLGGEEPARSK